MKSLRGQKCVRPHTRVKVFLASDSHLTNGSYASQIYVKFTARSMRNYHLQ